MSLDYNAALANALLDRYDTEFPAGSLLRIYSGGAPGSGNAATGTLLVEITLPSSPWAAAASKSKAKQNTWANTAIAAANAGYYRLINAADTKREEGTVTATGGGGDMTVDNISIAIGQTVTVTGYTRTLPI